METILTYIVAAAIVRAIVLVFQKKPKFDGKAYYLKRRKLWGWR